MERFASLAISGVHARECDLCAVSKPFMINTSCDKQVSFMFCVNLLFFTLLMLYFSGLFCLHSTLL